MWRYKKSAAKTIFKQYKTNLEHTIYEVNKHFYNMDFENARDQMEEYFTDIIRSCKNLITEMEGYHFL